VLVCLSSGKKYSYLINGDALQEIEVFLGENHTFEEYTEVRKYI